MKLVPGKLYKLRDHIGHWTGQVLVTHRDVLLYLETGIRDEGRLCQVFLVDEHIMQYATLPGRCPSLDFEGPLEKGFKFSEIDQRRI